MKRSLGLRDVVLLNIACVFGLSSLAQVAQFGFASISLCILAILTFLIPSGLMVAELNTRMPEQGGFYLWTRMAFGDVHGYVAAWTYWLSNITWLPTVMLLTSTTCLYFFGDEWLSLVENPWYNSVVCLGLLWGVTVLNIFGLERAKWIQNLGGIAVWLCVCLLIIAGGYFVFSQGPVQEFRVEYLIPDFSDTTLLPFFAIVAFSFAGMELAPVMAGEIKNPRRTIPRALFLSSAIVATLYIAGTLILTLTIAPGEVSFIEGVAQAFFEIGQLQELSYIGPIGALLVAFGAMGLFGSWMTGTARIPFVIGLDHYLPDAFAKIHPKYGSPYVALLVQASILTVLFLASIIGSTVKEAYLILLDMSIILYFIPFLYMFAAFVKHQYANTGGGGLLRLFEDRRFLVWIVGGIGFLVTLVSIILSFFPAGEIENKGLFVLKVGGGAALLIAVGLAVFVAKRKR